MGCELDLNVVLTSVKRPVAPAIGFFTQFIIMPLLGYTIALFLFSDDNRRTHLLALGLFVTGCSPGGGASNYWTVLLNGNANLSVTMTFLSTIGALVAMPFWINVLGSRILKSIYLSTDFATPSERRSVFIPYAKIVASLLMLVIPLLIGLTIAKYKPGMATKAKKLMRPFIIFVLVFIIIFGVSINLWLFAQITWTVLLAGLLLPWCGFMFGCFSSIILAQAPADVTAIAIETGVQNTGIAIMLLKLSFPGADSDLASLLPISVACFTPGPLLLGYAIPSAIKRIRAPRHDDSVTIRVSPDCDKVLINTLSAATKNSVIVR
ncbi:hypothetical protein niasHS_012270 [Heterodera schachtii]|uniref:Uncharacterized protein n=1 Tax=Heterodera schachtii TaxID=97005 RepID=A0ABD2IB63_HETSC